MNSEGGNLTDAGAVSFGGTQAAPAQFQVGKVGFAPAWSGALTDAMDDAGICTACGNRMTPVRPGKAQCDFCETTEHMAVSIVRLEHALDEANARIALLEEERNILGTASLSNALRGTTVTKAAVTEGAEPPCNDSAQVIRERPEPSPHFYERRFREVHEANARIAGELVKAREAIRAVLAEKWLIDPQCAEDQALVDRLKEEAAK